MKEHCDLYLMTFEKLCDEADLVQYMKIKFNNQWKKCLKLNIVRRLRFLKACLLQTTRDTFSAAKILKKGSSEVFDKWTKSHFSNFENGRSPDQKKRPSVFLTGKLRLAASWRNRNSHWVCKIKKLWGSWKMF